MNTYATVILWWGFGCYFLTMLLSVGGYTTKINWDAKIGERIIRITINIIFLIIIAKALRLI